MREVFFTGSAYFARVNISVPYDNQTSEIITAGRSLLVEEGLGKSFVADPDLYYLVTPGGRYADAFSTSDSCEIDRTIVCDPKHVRRNRFNSKEYPIWQAVSKTNVIRLSMCFAISGRDMVKETSSTGEARDRAIVVENVSQQNTSLLTVSDTGVFGGETRVRETLNEGDRTRIHGKDGEIDKEAEKTCTLEFKDSDDPWHKDVVQFRRSDGHILGELNPSVQTAYGELLRSGTKFECTVFRFIYQQFGGRSFTHLEYDILVRWFGPSIVHPTTGWLRSIGLGGSLGDGGSSPEKQAAFERGVLRG